MARDKWLELSASSAFLPREKEQIYDRFRFVCSGRLAGIGGASPSSRRPWPAPEVEDASWQATLASEKYPTADVRVLRPTEAGEGEQREIGQVEGRVEKAESNGQDTILALRKAEVHEFAEPPEALVAGKIEIPLARTAEVQLHGKGEAPFARQGQVQHQEAQHTAAHRSDPEEVTRARRATLHRVHYRLAKEHLRLFRVSEDIRQEVEEQGRVRYFHA